MTIVTPTGITGINSITSLVNDITFSTANGGSLTANGLSFTNLQTSSINNGPISGARNRIINGDMRIDQRNNGASVTPINGQYLVDRWKGQLIQTSKYSVQQNAGAVTPPPGFTNYLGVTSLSAYTLTGNDSFALEQIIEGYNVSDLDWGTVNAKPATLSFWVRSSLTGTFGGSIATTKTAIWVMPFSYSISAANTWTYVTVSITAPTSTGGTNNDNTSGVFVRFGLGATGTSAGGTAGTWTSAGNYLQPSGTVSVVGTNGATFYITGVQLEAGTVATPFERRSYGQELALCQRYALATSGSCGLAGAGTATNGLANSFHFPVSMRAAPTLSTSVAGSAEYSDLYATNVTAASSSYGLSSANNATSLVSIGGFTGLVVGRFYQGRPGLGTAVILFSAEL
jgi:hypothetical protein